MPISNKLKIAVRMSDLKSYEIAHRAEMHPSTLSRIICGIEKTKPNDPRVIAVGQVLDIPPEECFRENIQ
jgi:hypothetical protein